MAIYEYKCPKCKNEDTVHKPMAESSREEKCTFCGAVTARIYNSPGISTGDGRKI